MKPTDQMKAGFFQWRYYAWVLAVIWTIIIGASLGWNIYQTKQRTLAVAYIQAAKLQVLAGMLKRARL